MKKNETLTVKILQQLPINVEIKRFMHHGNLVYGMIDVAGTHRDSCLCYAACLNFKPGQPDNCPIAQELYELNVKHGIVTPVYECPAYEPDPGAIVVT